jgi:hypothetical protein
MTVHTTEPDLFATVSRYGTPLLAEMTMSLFLEILFLVPNRRPVSP